MPTYFHSHSSIWMGRLSLLSLLLTTIVLVAHCQKRVPAKLPDSVYSGKQGKFHVQGVAVDQKNGCIYFSFTDKLVKTDLSGNLIGSVTGFTGHLGDLDFDSASGTIYASLEFKGDAIGKSITQTLGKENRNNTGFYIAIFDGSRIDRVNMDAEKKDVLQTVYLKEVVDDYQAEVQVNGRKVKHRFGCSGIDGLTLAPALGGPVKSKKYLYVAYGIYGDTTRNDNDHQVILKYDVERWDEFGQHLSQEDLHRFGPEKPLEKYFVKTGNTTYGIQNLAYDSYSGNFYTAVYKGQKSQFPNYRLFLIDGHKNPLNSTLISDDKILKVKKLSLVEAGLLDKSSGIRGWHFPWGATGLEPLGNRFFYVSHNRKTANGQQESTLRKYKWMGDEKEAFVPVK